MSQTFAQLINGKSATVEFSAGSASTPAVSFSGDTNTGIYSPGADQVAISNNGVGTVFFRNGRLGVGESNPSGLIEWRSTNTGRLEADASTVSLNAASNAPLLFKTNDTERARIDTSGRLGLGTSSPSQTLTVAGNILTTSAAGTDSYVNVSTIGVQNTYLGFNNSGSTNSNGVLNNYSYVGNGNAYGLQFLANGGVKATLDSSGRLGIGTTSASANLHVTAASDGADAIRADANSGNGLMILRPDGANGNQIRFGGNGANANVLRFVSGGDTERARIDSSGRLLVGTSSNSVGSTIVCQGNSGSSTAEAVVRLNRGTAVPTSGQTLGAIVFGQSGSNDGAYILGEADAAWSASNDYPTRLVFSTTADGASSPTERMRITNGGAVQINTTSSSEAAFYLNVKAVNAAAFGDSYDSFSYGCVQIGRPADQPDNKFHLSFIRVGAQVAGMGFLDNSNTFAIQNAGDNTGAGVTLTSAATSWGTTSDERLKTITGNIANGLSLISDWRTVYFKYTNDDDDQAVRVGLIAQDVQATVPEAVSVEEDELGTLQLRYTELIPVLVKALQESKERIEQLEAKVAALEAV